MLELLKKVCIGLDSLGISYMLSGSLALNLYTVPRMTRDIDLVIQLEWPDLDDFLSLFKKGFYYNKKTVQEAIQNHTLFNMIDYHSGYKLDFMVLKTHPFRQNEFSRRIQTTAFGFPVWVVTLEDLILAKLLWIQDIYSDRQIDDIKHLLASDCVNMSYVQDWCHQLDLKTFGVLSHV